MLHERTFFKSGRLQNPLGRDGIPSASPNESRPRTLWEGSHGQREWNHRDPVMGEQAGVEGKSRQGRRVRAGAAVEAKQAQHERYWL